MSSGKPCLGPSAGGSRAASVSSIMAISLLGALIATFACGGGRESERPAPVKGSGTKRMAARLEEITNHLDPTKNIFLNTKRAAALRAGIEQTPSQKMVLQPVLADELLKAGKTEEAIAAAEALLHLSPHDMVEAPPPLETHQFLGLAYMRLGEQENCVAHHGVDSCLLPIKGTGVHTLTG